MAIYVLLKNGELSRYMLEKSKRPLYVKEDVKMIGNDNYHYHHIFTLYREGIEVLQKEFDSYCGQDRGPRRENIIRKMLQYNGVFPE